MGLGKFISKLVTAPIKIAIMPLKVICDVMESNDGLIETIEESVKDQVDDIIGD